MRFRRGTQQQNQYSYIYIYIFFFSGGVSRKKRNTHLPGRGREEKLYLGQFIMLHRSSIKRDRERERDLSQRRSVIGEAFLIADALFQPAGLHDH